MKSDLQRAKDEEQSLYSRLSQEQATVLTLNEKVRNTEKLRHEAEEKADDLSKKLTSLKEKYNVETQTLHESIVEKEKLIKEIREEAIRLRGCEVEKAINEEKEKSNARLDGILDQLAKSNESISTLKEELLSKGIEASKRQDEMVKLKEDLDVGIRERSFIREEKVHLSGELEKRQIEILNLEKQVVELSNSLELKGKSLEEAQNLVKKLQTQLAERENVLARFEAQGTNLAEILERNSQTGDSLQREREQLIRTLEERISEVEEMKSHREILAKKLKSKDKKVKELEEEKSSIINSLKIKHEELDAIMEDRSNIMAELKLRQIEVSKLKDENTSLSSLVEGKDGKREKEITKLLSRLKGMVSKTTLLRCERPGHTQPLQSTFVRQLYSFNSFEKVNKIYSACLRKGRGRLDSKISASRPDTLICYSFSGCMFVFEGSEQDLALTRKLLKTKGAMSGKGNSCFTSVANAWIVSSTAFDPRLLSNNPSFLFEKERKSYLLQRSLSNTR